ncbi:MAG: DUF4349 domain-containing protein [Planctomycetes bacterium]|nr:DUF4349 domain-containing protein [Planctomycetota bacterium]
MTMTGIAAALVLAFQIGDLRYGGFSLSRARELRNSVAGANVKGIGTSAEIYATDDASVYRIPSRPSERRARKDEGQQGRVFFDSVSAPTAVPSGSDDATGKTLQSLGYIGGNSRNASPAPAQPAPALVAQQSRAALAKPAQPSTEERNEWLKDLSVQKTDASMPAERDNAFKKNEGPLIATTGFEAPDWDAYKLGQSNNSTGPAYSGQGGGASGAQTPSPIPQNLKIIKTGELTIEVPGYGDSMARVEQIVREKGGFVADGSTHEEVGGALVGRMVVRMAPERFEETFAALKAVGRVLAENVKAADVTAEYVDLDARIKSLQITEERLRELIANKSFVDKIASLLEVEKEMNRVRTEIEQLQGQLRVMADRVGLSTIVLTVREPGRTVPSASLSVEVGTLAESASKMGDMLGKTDGRLVSGKTSKRSDGTLMGTYSIETNLARFAEVVGGIEALGRVEERQVKDQQFSEAGQPWAKNVTCSIALVLFERSRQLPTASVRIEVDKLDATMKRLSEILDVNDATLASNQASRMSDGSNSAEIKLRVPAGKFGGLFDALASLGRMTSKSVAGESSGIVGGAAAVPCDVSLTLAEKPREVPKGSMAIEVAAFDVARQALSRAIAERQVQVLSSSSNQRDDGTWLGSFRLGVPAKEMEGFVSKLESLGRVAARQITGLGLGDLSRIDPDSLGVIELTLAEKASFTPAPDEASASIRARIRDGLGGFYSSIGMIAYGLTVLLPWLLLAGIFGWLLARIRKAMRNRKAANISTL